MKKTTPPADIETLLALRKQIKSHQPEFLRQDAHKKTKLRKTWRRPKGLHSKVRENLRGYVSNLKRGYGSPKRVKGLHKTGLQPVLVTHIAQLQRMDKSTQGLILSGKMGARKKLAVLQEAEKHHLKILNLDPIKYKTQIEARQKERDELKKQLEDKKTTKTIEKTVEKDKKEESLDEKERKEQERREAEKVLTKRV